METTEYYNAGWNAFLYGEGFDPYPPRSFESEEWEKGYRDAEEEAASDFYANNTQENDYADYSDY